MEFVMRVLLGGIFGGVVFAIAWVALFTIVYPWPAHEVFNTAVFILGGTISAIASLKGMLW